MVKKFICSLTVAGILVPGVSVFNASFVGSAIAAEGEKKKEEEKKGGHLIIAAEEKKEEKKKEGGHLIIA